MNRFVFKLPKRKKFIFLSSKQFKVIRQIGSGGFARVYLVKCLIDNQLYAMKKIEFSRISNWDQENVQKEIKIHKKLNSNYVVKMIDYFQEDRIVYIILEYCEKGDLYEFIRKRSRMPSDMILSFFQDICNGIKYLHDNKIIMRDLKPENCLITKDERIKICDFGWACRYNDEEHYLKLQAGSLPYMAPESLRGDTASSKTDIWSLGVMLYELFFNKEPFLASSPETQLILIENSVLDFNPGFIIESAKDLIEKSLQLREIDRPTIEDLLESDYLNDKNQNYYSGIKERPSKKKSLKQEITTNKKSIKQYTPLKKQQRDHSTPLIKRYVIEHSASQKLEKESSQNKRKQIITNDIKKLAQENLIDNQQKNKNQEDQKKYYQIKKKVETSDTKHLNHRSKSVSKVLFQNSDNKYKNNKNDQIKNNIENNFRFKNIQKNQQKVQNENYNNLQQTSQNHYRNSNKIQNYQKQKSLILENPHKNKIKLKKTRASYVGFQKYSKSQNISQTRRQSIIRIEDLSREKRIADQVVQLLQQNPTEIKQKIPKYSVPYQKQVQHPVLKDIYQKKQFHTNFASQNKFIVKNQVSDKQIKLYNEKKNKVTSKRIKNDKILGYQQLMQNRNQYKNKMMALPVTETKQPKYYKKEQIQKKQYYKQRQQQIKSKSIQPKKQSSMFKDYKFNNNIKDILNISGR